MYVQRIKGEALPFLHFNPETQKYIVSVAKYWNWTSGDTSWMDDDLIGDEGQIPSIDVVKTQFVYDSEAEAIHAMRALWANI